MSREAVIALLGDAPAKRRSSSKSGGEEEAVKVEYWEYNYASGVAAPGPHPKAYAVYFDPTGRVSGFRGPTERAFTLKAAIAEKALTRQCTE